MLAPDDADVRARAADLCGNLAIIPAECIKAANFREVTGNSLIARAMA